MSKYDNLIQTLTHFLQVADVCTALSSCFSIDALHMCYVLRHALYKNSSLRFYVRLDRTRETIHKTLKVRFLLLGDDEQRYQTNGSRRMLGKPV